MNLVTLSGCNTLGEAPKFSIFSLSGAAMEEVDPRTLTDHDAGIYMLYWINKTFPGASYQELADISNPQTMGKKWWEKVGSILTSGVTNTVNLVKKGADLVGIGIGPGDTIQKDQGGRLSQAELLAIAALGNQTKQEYNKEILGMHPAIVIGGGIALAGLVLVLALRKK